MQQEIPLMLRNLRKVKELAALVSPDALDARRAVEIIPDVIWFAEMLSDDSEIQLSELLPDVLTTRVILTVSAGRSLDRMSSVSVILMLLTISP
jgi:hypothetical protein